MARTGRLVIRTFGEADAGDVLAVLGSEETIGAMRAQPQMRGRDEARRWIEHRQERLETTGYTLWAVALADGPVIGDCGFVSEDAGRYDIRWVIAAERQGQGYATEAAHAVVEYGFERLGARAVVAAIRPENTASIGVARRIGMQPAPPTADEHGPLLRFSLRR